MRLVLLIMLALAGAAQTGTESQIGAWAYSEVTDPMTDQVQPLAVTRSNGLWLSFGCIRRGELRTRVGTDDFFGEGLRDVVLRFDDQSPRRDLWRYMDQAAYPLGRKGAAKLATEVMRATRLRIRVFTYRNNTVDADFSLAESSRMLGLVAQRCGVSLT